MQNYPYVKSPEDFFPIRIPYMDIQSIFIMAMYKHSITRNNLRQRNPIIQFDSLLRGYIGENAVQRWLSFDNGIRILSTDIMESSSNMDIDLTLERKSDGRTFNTEIKTSMIPDIYKDLNGLMGKTDIKLIRRQGQPIEQLKGDLHIQLYFPVLKNVREGYLSGLENDPHVKAMYDVFHKRITPKDYFRDLSTYGNDGLGETLGLLKIPQALSTVLVAGWTDKDSLIRTQPNTWNYGYRSFFECKIGGPFSKTYSPDSLPEFLK